MVSTTSVNFNNVAVVSPLLESSSSKPFHEEHGKTAGEDGVELGAYTRAWGGPQACPTLVVASPGGEGGRD